MYPKFLSSELVISDGAGNLPVTRITTRASLDAPAGALSYEDHNFPDRAGWKEIVIVSGKGATLRQASQSSKDVTKGLTSYPPDPTVAPPQDLRAELTLAARKTSPRARRNANFKAGNHADSSAEERPRGVISGNHDRGSRTTRKRRTRRYVVEIAPPARNHARG